MRCPDSLVTLIALEKSLPASEPNALGIEAVCDACDAALGWLKIDNGLEPVVVQN